MIANHICASSENGVGEDLLSLADINKSGGIPFK